jgi:hypothetical protein
VEISDEAKDTVIIYMTCDTLFYEEKHNDLQDLQINEIQCETVVWKSIKARKFLLVNFLGGHRNKIQFKYVCLMQSVDDDDRDVVIQGLKKVDCIGIVFN